VVTGVGDFDGDMSLDLVWRDASGLAGLVLLQNGSGGSNGMIPLTSPNWDLRTE
jgi:hypothetical protein